MKLLLFILLVSVPFIVSIAKAETFFSPLKKTKDIERADPEIVALFQRLEEMGQMRVIMPVEIFGLARAFVDYPDREKICDLLRHAYPNLHHHFQKRVFFTFLRFAQPDEFKTPGIELASYISAGLDDDMTWVQYDAAWLALVSKTVTPEILAKLKPLSEMKIEDETDNSLKSLKSRAQEALTALSHL